VTYRHHGQGRIVQNLERAKEAGLAGILRESGSEARITLRAEPRPLADDHSSLWNNRFLHVARHLGPCDRSRTPWTTSVVVASVLDRGIPSGDRRLASEDETGSRATRLTGPDFLIGLPLHLR
jgi:hypothetical protein